MTGSLYLRDKLYGAAEDRSAHEEKYRVFINAQTLRLDHSIAVHPTSLRFPNA